MKFNLDSLVSEYEHLESELGSAEVFSNPKKLKELMQKKKMLQAPVEFYRTYKKLHHDLENARELLESGDEDMRTLAKEEKESIEKNIISLEADLQLALLPQDPNDNRNVILEVRAGTGGEEASLFAGELFHAYLQFSEIEGYATEILDISRSDGKNSIKEGIVKIKGDGAYSRFKYESGVHRVQRIPATENKGRVHTSAITVAILPEADEIDVEIRDEDLEITACRASGAGGQHVNKTSSAIRMVHIPTGVVVECQDERSQLKNKAKALAMLRSRILAMEIEKADKERSQARASQVGSGDRSEKIRTYNFPQDRLTDHRIHENFSNLPGIMEGNLTDVINACAREDQARKLEHASKTHS